MRNTDADVKIISVLLLSCLLQLSSCWFSLKTNENLNGSLNTTSIRHKRQQNCDYRCNSGECLSSDFLCDGSTECADGSDETAAQCQGIRCPAFLHQCKYGACIPQHLACNGEKNCADNSDEEGPNCTSSKVTGRCTNFEFRCNDGSCIDILNTCDGIKDCPDGSDETEDVCTGLVCQNFLFRCDYGACVAKSAKCNGVNDCADGSDEVGCGTTEKPEPEPTPLPPPVTPPTSGCVLPAHLANGKYSISAGGEYKVNKIIKSSTVISLTCNEGFVVKGTYIFYCLTNQWTPSISSGDCIRRCPSLKTSDTYNAVCRGEDGGIVSCEEPTEGTRAFITCKPYYTFYGTRQIPICRSGHWDPFPAPCDPECGQKIVNAQTLIIGGSDALPGEYPWMVAIYDKVKGHICGGTIISRFFVVSAAHCFSDNKGLRQEESAYTIVAGKYYRDLNIKENGTQERQIKRLRVHEDFKGSTTKYRDDIALLEVDKFEMTAQVQPACVDWGDKYEAQDFQENNKAVVAGWGNTMESSTPSEVLKKLIVPFRTTETCRQFMDPDFFKQYYSSDKICAGYKDQNSSVCSGDSGGGLYFRSQPDTFYIRAVVSLAPRSATGCNSNHYALYTKLSKYLEWIEGITFRRL